MGATWPDRKSKLFTLITPSPRKMDELAIDVQDITKSFNGHVVVDGLAMQVRRGEIYGFLGPNGSGKTTFLRILCGLLKPDAGSGTCLGHNVITESDAIKRRVGYMTQRFSLYEDLSIAENLRFVADIYEMPHPAEAVNSMLESLGLERRSEQLAGQLSGGWKQRLALAACLIHRPQLLLLDEPTAGVDPKARRDFWEEIHRLAAEGLTVLVTTHYMDEAERCHRLAYIAYGKLLAKGTLSDVLASARLTTWEVSGSRPWAALSAAPRFVIDRASYRVREQTSRQWTRCSRARRCHRSLPERTIRLAQNRTGPGRRFHRSDADRSRQFRMNNHFGPLQSKTLVFTPGVL